MVGTIRAYSEDDRDGLQRLLAEVATGVANAYGCAAAMTISHGELVLTNDHRLAATVIRSVQVGGLRSTTPVKSCGADDFSYFASVWPSLMIFAGTGDALPRSPGLHHPQFAPPETDVAQVATIMMLSYFGIVEDLLSDDTPALALEAPVDQPAPTIHPATDVIDQSSIRALIVSHLDNAGISRVNVLPQHKVASAGVQGATMSLSLGMLFSVDDHVSPSRLLMRPSGTYEQFRICRR